MKCSCLKEYDFVLLNTERCADIAYLDRSIWQTGAEFQDQPAFQLNLKLPDGTTKTYDGKAGIPLPLNLGDCVEGVVTFSVTSCTEVFSKKAAITCLLWCGYLKAFRKLGSELDLETLRSIRERIELAESVVSTDYLTSISLIKSVSRDLARINCSCSCG